MPERRYTDEEVAQILKRASELQGQGRRGTSAGATEFEIRAAAQEVGIDPALLDQAFAELGSGQAQPPTATRYEHEESFVGHLTSEAWEDLVSQLRRDFGEEGTVGVRPGIWEWTATGGGLVTTHLSARQDGDLLRVVGWSRSEGMLGMIGALCMIPFFLTIGLMVRTPLIPVLRVGVVALVVFLLFVVARSLHARQALGGRRKLLGAIRALQKGLQPVSAIEARTDASIDDSLRVQG